MKLRRIFVLLASTTLLASAAQAQPLGAQPFQDVRVIPLAEWRYDELYREGWSADEFIENAEVYGVNGEEIGDVENLVIGPDGRILSVIVEVGGFWDIGDTHVSVPWSEVSLRPVGDGITVPITEETVDDYSIFRDELLTAREATASTRVVDDDLLAGPRAWRATELIGDYVRLRGGWNYGYVNDLVFNNLGELRAVVVSPDVGWGYGLGGYYAYPYYGYGIGWHPGYNQYRLPYTREEIETVGRFDREMLGTRFE